MNKSHTPGPWQYNARLSGSENHKGYYIKCQRFVLADVIPVDTDGIEGKANARLIAASPDLLEALESLAAYCERATENGFDPFDADQWLEGARIAIAKVRGES